MKLDLIAAGPDDAIDAGAVVERFGHGQLLVAGWGTVAPAVQVRRIQQERRLFLETFLAATYPIEQGRRAVVLLPFEDASLPPLATQPVSIAQLRATVPSYCVVLDEYELPRGERRGDWQTYAHVMSLWERLHAPFLAAADAGAYPLQKIEGYRRTIEVDYACELAHQKLAGVANELARACPRR